MQTDIKIQISQLIGQAINALQGSGVIPSDVTVAVHVERTRDKKHGDFASNIALLLAKPCAKSPRQVAELIVDQLSEHKLVEAVSIADPGFINFTVTKDVFFKVISDILTQREQFGCSQIGNNQKVHIEYVSANPTGPLHVGHGRSAAYGASLANLLEVVGYQVHREYYVNDAGRQMDILAVSVWLRYLAACGLTQHFPSNGYQGDYVIQLSQQLLEQYGDQFSCDATALLENIPADESAGGDKERHIDALILRAKQRLGEDHYRVIHQFALTAMLETIQSDLAEFGVTYQHWFSERSLLEQDLVTQVIERLQELQCTYEKEGALWFNAMLFGDEKDRVLRRSNGQMTYFAADIAYHLAKCRGEYDRVIDVLGADHHGYIPRVRAAMRALGASDVNLEMLLVQFAILYRGKERLSMSTRSGSFITLRELCEEVGNDAARFFYVMRKSAQHVDFDLELAKSQTADNPVFYIQYAYARICSVLRQLVERDYQWDEAAGLAALQRLQEPQELALVTQLMRYPEVIHGAANTCEPHLIAHYLRDLANVFHVYYNAHQFIVADDALRNARLCLIIAIQQVVRNGLAVLGVSTPERM